MIAVISAFGGMPIKNELIRVSLEGTTIAGSSCPMVRKQTAFPPAPGNAFRR
ncbi:hypothetical protein [Luteimonas lutimaris]|uniref:hypothetical protein n=1 Tax=Luteimonas lutimaris TaxID=698645 RepID=UPI0031E43FEA